MKHLTFLLLFTCISTYLTAQRQIISQDIYFKKSFVEKDNSMMIKYGRKMDSENIKNSSIFISVFKAGDLLVYGYYNAYDEKYMMFGYREFQ